MRSLILPLLALLSVAPGAALAQTVPPSPIGSGTPSVTICYTTPNSNYCPAIGGLTSSPGLDAYTVPLSSLAYASTTDALAAGQRKAENVVSGGVAMSAALDMIAPADGRTNRIGGGVSTFNDQTGLALTYTRQAGSWDAGIGLASSRYQNMAKATIGFSW